MSGTYTSDEKVEYALKTALFRTMQSKDQPSSVEKSAPPRIFPKNIMKKNLIEKGEGDIDEDGYYVGGTGSAYGSNDLANLEEPELTITNYRIIDPVSNKITNKRVSDLTTVNMSQTSHNSINALPTTGTNYPLKSWFFRGHYGSHSGEAAFNAANSSYDGLQLAWDKSTVGNTATEADIVPHLKFYLQVQTEYTNVAHGDNISYGHDLMKGLIGLDQNFSTTIQVVQGQGGSCVTLGETGTSTGDFWFTQATAGILSFYGVTNKVNASDALNGLSTTKFPMISFIRYVGETGFGAGSGGGGGSVALTSADPNVSTMIGGTAQTMTTTSFEFDGNVNITGDLAVTGSGAGIFKGVQSDSLNNILISGNETWNGNTTGLYNTTLGWAAGYQMTSGKENTLIGMNAGINMTTGEKNTLIGNFAGKSLSTGHSNECLGYKAGHSISTGVYNVFIGKEAAVTCTASQNVVIGHQAGYSGTSRSNCVFVGNQAGYDWNSNNQVGIGYRAIHHKKGDKNVAVGYNCMGDSSPDGTYAEMNTAIGAEALHKLNGNASSYGSYNVAVGHRAGYALTTASKNILIGDQAGAVLTTTWGNIIIGYQNGYQLKSGSGSNVLIGLNNVVASGNSTAYYCNCIGYNAGRTLSTGYKNDLIGFNCGYAIDEGSNNCGYGAECLRLLTSGTYNTCLGSYSGYYLTTGGHNTFIGVQAGNTHKTGDSNVCIGHNAGYYDETCERSIFIGRHAGCASNKGTGTGYGEGGKNDQLFINSYMSGNTYTGTNQFIYGYMKMDDNPFIKFNCDVKLDMFVSSSGRTITNSTYKTKSWAQAKTEMENHGGSMPTRDQLLSLETFLLQSGQDKWAPGVTRLGGGEAYKQWYQLGNTNHVYGREHPGYPSWGDGTTSYDFRDTISIVSKPLKINHGFFINHYEHSAAWGQAVFQMVAASTNYCTMGFAKGTDSGSNDNVLEALTFTRNGNVGIGTSSPGYNLEVVGNMKCSSYFNAGSYYRVESGIIDASSKSSSEYHKYNFPAGSGSVGNGVVVRIFRNVHDNGSWYGSNGFECHCYPAGYGHLPASYWYIIRNISRSGNGIGKVYSHGLWSYLGIWLKGGRSYKYTIIHGNGFSDGGESISTAETIADGSAGWSDDRIKHNEIHIDNGLSIINQLKPQKYIKTENQIYHERYNFELDADSNPLDPSGNPLDANEYKIETGLIAQDVEKIEELKYLVSNANAVDHNGVQLKAVYYQDIFVYNIAATQELHKKQQADEAKIAELEAKVSTLESELATIKQHLGL